MVFPSWKIIKPKVFLLSKGRVISLYHSERQEYLQSEPQNVSVMHHFYMLQAERFIYPKVTCKMCERPRIDSSLGHKISLVFVPCFTDLT